MTSLQYCCSCKTGGTPEHQLKRCTGCGNAAYCSKECQMQDWKRHKKECLKSYTIFVSSARPIASTNHGIVTKHGPFHMGIAKEFMAGANLTADVSRCHPTTLSSFGITQETLFDSRRGGFGGMMVETSSNGLYIGDGWNHRITTLESALGASGLNIHAWCVNQDDECFDYADDYFQAIAFFSSETITRVPFPMALQQQLLPHLKMIFNSWLETSGKTLAQHLSTIRRGHFNVRMCWHRAMVLAEAYPDQYQVVVGSLGFVQDDGINTFWVWG